MSATPDIRAFAPAIVVPASDPAQALPARLGGIIDTGIAIIIVDDGSAGGTSDVLAAWRRDNPSLQVALVPLAQPSGRDAVLRAGFAAAEKAGYTHALTLDPEINDNPANISDLLAAAREHPHDLILATSHDADFSAGPHGGWARRLTSVLLRLEAGVAVHDPHRGLRVYPLALVALTRCRARGSAYEVEILARAAWAGCRILEVRIGGGAAPGSRSSHSLSLPDMLRSAAMHVRLLARRLSGWPHTKYLARHAVTAAPPFWRGLGQWLNPLRAWRELRRGELGRTELATGIAVGVFIANLPVFGVQTLLALYVARRLHLHPLAVVAGSKASTPPVGPLLVAAAIWLGHLLLHGSRLTWKGLLRPVDGHLLEAMLPLLLDWIVGATLIGTGMAVITFAIANFLFRSVPARPDKAAAP